MPRCSRLPQVIITFLLELNYFLHFAHGFLLPIIKQRLHAAIVLTPSVEYLRANRHNDIIPNEDELEHETLTSLSEKLKLYCEERTQEGGEDEDEDRSILQVSLLYTRLSNLSLNRTIVRPSKIHGMGLFALCDCKKGDLLTCYPGDALVIMPEGDDAKEGCTILWGSHVINNKDGDYSKEYNNNNIDDLLGYVIHAIDDYGVLGLPSLNQDPAYYGHFANDGVSNLPLTEADLSTYVIESDEKANAMHNDLAGCHMVTVATRDIKKGEEILVTYGPDYWAEQSHFIGGSGIGSSSSSTSVKDDDNNTSRPNNSKRGFG